MTRTIRMAGLAMAVTLLFSGLALAQRDHDNDDDGGYYNRPDDNIGYQDGSTVARQDMESGKRFNPNPRGPYDDKDHGYQRVYGDKNAYKTQYTNGYRAGYQSNFNRGYSGY